MYTNKASPISSEETHPNVRTASDDSAALPAPATVAEFDAAEHHKEIAQVAYRIWLERAYSPGSPDDDWLEAVSEVRAKYSRNGN